MTKRVRQQTNRFGFETTSNTSRGRTQYSSNVITNRTSRSRTPSNCEDSSPTKSPVKKRCRKVIICRNTPQKTTTTNWSAVAKAWFGSHRWFCCCQITKPTNLPDKDELHIFAVLVTHRLEKLTKDELMWLIYLARMFYYKQSYYIEYMDKDGYRYDNPRHLIFGKETDDVVSKKIVRRIASLLIKLCPTGIRTKDSLAYVAQYPLPKEYHEIKLMQQWTPTSINCSGQRPTMEELKAALIEKRCLIGPTVHFTHVDKGVIRYVYPIEGNTTPKRRGNELADDCIFVCTKEGGELIFAYRNADGKVEIQTRTGSEDGNFNAPKRIFKYKVRTGGGISKDVILRFVYFSHCRPELRMGIATMILDHMSRVRMNGSYYNGRLVYWRENNNNASHCDEYEKDDDGITDDDNSI